MQNRPLRKYLKLGHTMEDEGDSFACISCNVSDKAQKAHYFAYENGCVEDFGFERMNMKFAGQVQVEDLGMNIEDVEKNDPSCIQINGTTAIHYNLDSPNPDRLERNTIVFYHRKTDYGREMRIRLWYGIGVENGQYIHTVPEQERALNIAKYCMTHMMEESTNDEILEKKPSGKTLSLAVRWNR